MIDLRPRRTVPTIVEVTKPVPLEEAIKLALVDHGYKLLDIKGVGSYVIEVAFTRDNKHTHKLCAWTEIDQGHGGDRDDWLYNSFLGVLHRWEKEPKVGPVPGGKVVEA